jgi:hypothetical protein
VCLFPSFFSPRRVTSVNCTSLPSLSFLKTKKSVLIPMPGRKQKQKKKKKKKKKN